ncbi:MULTISPECIES: hypothetical protein [unclassified Bradyrhizobium]|uniref:hypothetical protein n=1 Tax=unclassified Bradyrhizobium TaxID=2631580 RepID=UPI00211E00CC|nr:MULTISPECIES: hypothetical protein [unclassified Bradyrhizobium]MDD1537911.1 hypothetical protein [Bradyrhizobium sp. WBOS8]MDD1587394.1 hypothetical protein [Bradyrhizobium sp. WBOS4]UUO45479.1 hypothetical protein DCM78_00060 [Bradyrhizobium sp. WBOS04]UUO59096.1 hypothetical protein DCM80_07795 [Bradyrhizobium sp. WBOS08]
MADRSSKKEFGKRRPVAEKPPPRPPVKRSGHVALLVMGTIAVGTTAYTLMPRQNCEPTPGAVPGQTTTTCSSSSSGSSSGSSSRWSSRSSLFSSDSSSHSSSATSSDSGHSSVSRGGFGSFGHGFSGGG